MLGLRAYDARGRQVAARLAWLRDGLAELGQAPDAGEKPWLDDGDDIVRLIAALVHREADPRSINEAAIREWQAEGRGAEREQTLRMGRLARAFRESGGIEEEFAESIGSTEVDVRRVMRGNDPEQPSS